MTRKIIFKYPKQKLLSFAVTIFMAVGLMLPAVVSAGTTEQIISECVNNGELTSHYSQKELSNAIKNLPDDITQYTDAIDCINNARVDQLSNAHGKDKTGSVSLIKAARSAAAGGSSKDILVPATAAERKLITSIQKNGDKPLKLAGGDTINPNSSGIPFAAIASKLPSQLVYLFALLLVSCVLVVFLLIRERRSGQIDQS